MWCGCDDLGAPTWLWIASVQQFHGMSSTESLHCLQSHGDRGLSVAMGGSHLACQLSWMCNTQQVKSSSRDPCPALNSSGLDMKNQSSWKLQMVRLPSRLPWRWGWLPKGTGFFWQRDLFPTLGKNGDLRTLASNGPLLQSFSSVEQTLWRQTGLGWNPGSAIY